MQAKSDLDAAKAVRKDSEFSTYCQALAKYQQVTEKSVKSMIAALNEAGFLQVSISGNHALEHEINGLDALRRKKPGIDNASLEAIDKILKSYRSKIALLSSLAPSGPKGSVYPRNTEYPFHADAALNNWTAPAAEGTYTLVEVTEAHKMVWPLHHLAAKFTSSLRRRR